MKTSLAGTPKVACQFTHLKNPSPRLTLKTQLNLLTQLNGRKIVTKPFKQLARECRGEPVDILRYQLFEKPPTAGKYDPIRCGDVLRSLCSRELDSFFLARWDALPLDIYTFFKIHELICQQEPAHQNDVTHNYSDNPRRTADPDFAAALYRLGPIKVGNLEREQHLEGRDMVKLFDMVIGSIAEQKTIPFAYLVGYFYLLMRIHPMLDGNGRTCRRFSDLMFIKNGYYPVDIDYGLRPDWVKAIRAADLGNLGPLLAFYVKESADKARWASEVLRNDVVRY